MKTRFPCLLIIIFCIITVQSYPDMKHHAGEDKHADHEIKRWAYVTAEEVNAKTGVLARYMKIYNVLTVTGFTLQPDGSLKIGIPEERIEQVLKKATERHVTVYPLVTASSGNAGISILGDTKTAAVKSVSALVGRYGFRGIHIDIEHLPQSSCTALAGFLSECRAAVAPARVTLALFPQVEFPAEKSLLHDIKAIAPSVDEIVLMCYDYHDKSTGPGPVTGAAWASRNVNEVLRHMKPDRLWLGIPAYGYRWKTGNGSAGTACEALSAREAERLAIRYGSVRDTSGTVRVRYSSGSSDYTVYYSNAGTRSILEEIVRKKRLAGSALWRPGLAESLP